MVNFLYDLATWLNSHYPFLLIASWSWGCFGLNLGVSVSIAGFDIKVGFWARCDRSSVPDWLLNLPVNCSKAIVMGCKKEHHSSWGYCLLSAWNLWNQHATFILGRTQSIRSFRRGDCESLQWPHTLLLELYISSTTKFGQECLLHLWTHSQIQAITSRLGVFLEFLHTQIPMLAYDFGYPSLRHRHIG